MDINKFLDSIDIVDYISQFVELTPKNGEFWGLSCFKQENTPSFSVRRDPPVFNDFSSGKGGGLLKFVCEYFNCSKHEAVDILKKYAGYEGEIEEGAPEMEATKVFKQFRPPIQKEKKSRQVLNEHVLDKYDRRSNKLDVWRREGISNEVLKKFQVMYDPFSNRLVYPIRSPTGDIVNIGGRTLDPEWKEKGLRKYTYFYKWEVMDVIYGLYEHYQAILDAGEIILFEGCKSVYIAETWGIRNTGAILTSHLNDSQMKILAKLAQPVVFALDKDVNILADKRVKQLKNYVPVYFIMDLWSNLDAKDSPVDKGEGVFKNLYERKFKLR